MVVHIPSGKWDGSSLAVHAPQRFSAGGHGRLSMRLGWKREEEGKGMGARGRRRTKEWHEVLINEECG